MADMTQTELTQHITDTFKSLVSKELLDTIKDTVNAQVQPYQQAQTDLISKLWAQKSEDKPKRAAGQAFGRIVRAIAGQKQRHPADALKAWGDEDLAEAFLSTQKAAMSAGTGSAGGFLVPVQYAQDLIPLRRAATVVRGSGPREIPMPTGTVKIPKITAGSTGGYIGENTNLPISQVTLGQITLTWKKLAVLVPISNDLLRYSSPAADAVVRDDIVAGLAVLEDAAFLRSQGVDGEPMGLRYLAPSAHVIDAQTASLSTVSQDLGKLILKLKEDNVPLIRPVFLMHPRSEHYLLTIQNSDGFFAFRDEMLTRKTVFGVPYKITTSIPINITVGSNSDCSEIYLADFDSLVLGDSEQLTVDVSSEAAYYNGSSVVSAFSLDQTVVRAVAEHDFNARDANAIAVLNAVRWAA